MQDESLLSKIASLQQQAPPTITFSEGGSGVRALGFGLGGFSAWFFYVCLILAQKPILLHKKRLSCIKNHRSWVIDPIRKPPLKNSNLPMFFLCRVRTWYGKTPRINRFVRAGFKVWCSRSDVLYARSDIFFSWKDSREHRNGGRSEYRVFATAVMVGPHARRIRFKSCAQESKTMQPDPILLR